MQDNLKICAWQLYAIERDEPDMMLSPEDGAMAVKLARDSIERFLRNDTSPELPQLPLFSEKRGVFVSLHTIEGGARRLRGCIGRPYPVLPLGEAISVSAVDAAARDPRFHPVRSDELSSIVIEVTVLTMPDRIHAAASELPGRVIVGQHGLIVKNGMCVGLLLPQVATEYGFDAEEFLCQTCMKAGLPPDMWLDADTEIYCFEGQVFEETSPGGDVHEKNIRSCK